MMTEFQKAKEILTEGFDDLAEEAREDLRVAIEALANSTEEDIRRRALTWAKRVEMVEQGTLKPSEFALLVAQEPSVLAGYAMEITAEHAKRMENAAKRLGLGAVKLLVGIAAGL